VVLRKRGIDEAEDGAAVERLARYIMRPPISLERMAWDGVGEVRYRRKRWKAGPECESAVGADTSAPSRAARDEARNARALRRSWAQLIKRIYEVDPLVCPSCGSKMKVIAFIIEHDVVDAILRHLKTREKEGRGPPGRSEHHVVS